MAEVWLASFNNTWYQAGRSRFWQAAWFFIGLPLLRCSTLPFSGMRVLLLRVFGARVGNCCTLKPGIA